MRHLAATVPGARLVEFESAHMINLEHPERFTALLREHFATERPAST
jgi:pimeloyl-ACP methyl ester carboxylesterase